MIGISAFPACATTRFEIQETALTFWRVKYTPCTLPGDLHSTLSTSRGDKKGTSPARSGGKKATGVIWVYT